MGLKNCNSPAADLVAESSNAFFHAGRASVYFIIIINPLFCCYLHPASFNFGRW